VLLQLGRDLSVREGLIQSRLLRSGPPARTTRSQAEGRPPGGQQHRREDRHWLTIGGGRARGETLAEAGARELREEAGIDVAPAALGEPLGTTVVRYAAFALLPVTQYQTYFAVAVDAVEVTAEHQGLLERLTIERHEWLTVEDLERRPERLVDLEMPRLMRAAVAAVRARPPAPSGL
jgi:8-oxo-dGTP pyrophosphatase MutT (NUDIX family)